MVTRLFYSCFIPGIVFLTSCTTLKRYSSLLETGASNKIADIDLFETRLSDPETGSNGKSLWDLSADAQSQFIKILNSRYADNEMFLNALSNVYMKPVDEVFTDNYTKRDLRMVFSVSRKRNYQGKDPYSGIKITPADRIEYLHISLRIREDSILRFLGWNMYSTEYGSVDIADVSFSRSLTLNASGTISSKSDNNSVESSAGTGSTLSRKEDQSIKYRYLKLNGKLNNNSIEMEEEGTREIDLTGNIIADVSLGFNTFPEMLTRVTGIKDSMGRFSDPGKLRMGLSLVLVPAAEGIKDTIFADLEMDFVYRNVDGGSKTFPEWDDRVRFYTGKVIKPVVLLSAQDYVPDFYSIGIVTENGIKKFLKIRSVYDKETDMKFRSYSEASAFYEWLYQYFSTNQDVENKLVIDDQILMIEGKKLSFRDVIGNYNFRVLPCYY